MSNFRVEVAVLGDVQLQGDLNNLYSAWRFLPPLHYPHLAPTVFHP